MLRISTNSQSYCDPLDIGVGLNPGRPGNVFKDGRNQTALSGLPRNSSANLRASIRSFLLPSLPDFQRRSWVRDILWHSGAKARPCFGSRELLRLQSKVVSV